MVDMVNKDILPAISDFIKALSEGVNSKKAAVPTAECKYEEKIISKLSTLSGVIYDRCEALDKSLIGAMDSEDALKTAVYYKDTVFKAMNELRLSVDEAEIITDRKYWPYPGYGELLFSVR